MKYICNQCEDVFDEEDFCINKYHDSSPYLPDGGMDEVEYCCPNCGSDDYDEATECERCGKYVREDDIHGGLCDECIEAEIDAITPEMFRAFIYDWSIDKGELGEFFVEHMRK